MIKQEKLYDGWIFIKLGEVSEIIMGQSPPSSTYNKENNGLPFFQGKTEFGRRHPKIKMYCSSPKKTATENDILMSVRAPVGPVNIVNNDCCIGRGLCAIRSSDKLDFMYLYHFLKANEVKISSKGTGSTFTAINKKTIHELEIPLPPLNTQKKIVAILEKAERLKEWRKEADELTDEFLKSTFLEMFGYPVTNPKNWDLFKFSKIGSLQRGKSKHRPRNAPELLGGIYPLIQTGNVANSGWYIREYDQTYSELGLSQSKMWPAETLCITIAANIAKTGILTFDACFPDSIVGFKPNKNARVEYVQFWLSFLQKMLEDIAPESAQKNINLKILSNLNIPLPPLPLQQKFASIVRQVEQLREHQSQSRQHIDDLFNVLMQKAFKGELN